MITKLELYSLIGLLLSPLAFSALAVETSRGAILRPGKPVERMLRAEESHVYEVELSAGRAWRLNVEQKGIDVSVRVSGPEGFELIVDAPTYRRGPETLFLRPEAAGAFQVAVRSRASGVGPGVYQIELLELDGEHLGEARIAAEASATDAGRLRFLGTAEARVEAIARYREAAERFRALGLDRRRAWARLAVAILHLRSGEPGEALEQYRVARPLFHDLGERYGEANAANDMGLCLSRLEEIDSARIHLERARVLYQQLDDPFGEATASSNLCLIDHRRGDLPAARICYEQTLKLLRQAGEHGQEAPVLSNLGNVYDRLGEPAQAIDAYQRSLAIRRSTGDRRGEARTLNNLGVLHRRLGEPQGALASYGAALETFRRLEDERWQARTLSNMGSAYFVLGEPDRARTFLERALAMRRETGDTRGEAATLNTLGRVHTHEGETATAVEHHAQALRLSQEIEDPRGQANALSLLAGSHLAAGDPASTLRKLGRVLEILPAAGDLRIMADVLHQSGEAYLLLGEYEQALASLDQAVQHRHAIGDLPGEAESLSAAAAAEAGLGKIDVALRRVEAALTVIELLRWRIADPDLRATFSSSRQRAYELEIDLLMRLHAATPERGHARAALEASERARARSLVDLLHEAGAGIRKGVDPELHERWSDLRRRLNAKAFRRAELLSRRKAEGAAQLEFYEVLGELQSVEAEIRKRSPAFAALTRPRPLSAGEVQGLLDEGMLLLEYSLGEERSFLWAVTPTNVEAFELPGREQLETVARDAYRALSSFDGRANQRQAVAPAHLSRMVLGPIAKRLDRQRLIVVADGALHYIPFGALPLLGAGAPGRPGLRGDRLLQRHEVVYLPSAAALVVQRRSLAGRRPAPRRVAVLADPVFAAYDPRIVRARSDSAETSSPIEAPDTRATFREPILPGPDRSFGLDRLVASRHEASAIAEMVPGEALLALDFEASRELAFSGELRRYQIVHFATHGLIDGRRPELSGLVLSLFDREGNARDGFLRLRDLYNLELAGDLVVLSGCRTALGRELRGEGLVGLTRGFMYAGMPRVVASLWRVEDRATAELMTRFYRALLIDGLPPPAALRRAQLSLAGERTWADPFFWAAFVLQGDWR